VVCESRELCALWVSIGNMILLNKIIFANKIFINFYNFFFIESRELCGLWVSIFL
jgi:hypothetical protein